MATLVVTVGLTYFIATAPAQPWALALTLVLAALGLDGPLRSHPRAPARGISGTVVYLVVPVAYVMGTGLFFREIATGHWRLLAGILSGIGYGVVAHGEYLSVATSARTYDTARLVCNVGAYVAAFTVYGALYSFGIRLPVAALGVGLITFLLSLEMFREVEPRAEHLLVMAAITAVVLAEVRLVLYYLPLADLLAAIALLLTFYVVTGLVQAAATGAFGCGALLEFGAVAGVGLVFVIAVAAATAR